MVSRQQKRVWRYVDDGCLMKLKSYLRMHRDLDVNFSQGRRKRSPLHLACLLGDDAALRLLLKRGADVLRKDRKGDTALHYAANRVLKHGNTAYFDLVVPLKKSCPEALNAPNKAGVTPQDLLNLREKRETAENMGSPCEGDSEEKWWDKLMGECMDEFCETSTSFYDDDFDDEADGDYDSWVEHIRLASELLKRTHAEFERLVSVGGGSKRGNGKREREREREKKSRKEECKRQQREHEEYLARAARKEEETRQSKKRRYEEGCAATFHGGPSAGSSKLSFSDIPWPAPRGTVQEMVDVMLHGLDRTDVQMFRKVLRKQQALWHPDKFTQRCGARLEEKDKQRILDTVTALSQELNRLAQTLKT